MTGWNFEDGFFGSKGKEDKPNKGGEHDCDKCPEDVKKMCNDMGLQDRLSKKDRTKKLVDLVPEVEEKTRDFLFKVFVKGAESYKNFQKNGNELDPKDSFATICPELQMDMLRLFYEINKKLLDK